MTFNLGVVIAIPVAFQLLFVALYLFTHKKGNRRNNRLLALVFFMFGMNLVDFMARVGGVSLPYPLLHLLDDCFFFLYGPVLYFYTQGVVYADFEWKKHDLWHFVPYIVISIALVIQAFAVGLEAQRGFSEQMVTGEMPTWVPLVTLGMYSHIFIYLFLSWKIIKHYQSVIRNQFSSIDEINLDWLSFMIRAFFAITVVALVNSIVPLFGSVYYLYFTVLILLVLSFYFVTRVLVRALNQPAIFSGIQKEEPEKYAMSTLEPSELNRHMNRLRIHMETEQPYLQSSLKSKDLADAVGISTKMLSQVINQGFGQNFFDYVNTYRCEEVKKILRGPDEKITVIEAMYASGFNSKSSFNKEFKKLTGQTPNEFRKNQ